MLETQLKILVTKAAISNGKMVQISGQVVSMKDTKKTAAVRKNSETGNR